MFAGGICAYSDELKQHLLGVRAETLSQYGAISRKRRRRWLERIRAVCGTDIGAGITGIAGPDGGTEDKPVGLVFISVSSKDHSETKQLFLARGFDDERGKSIRHMAMMPPA